MQIEMDRIEESLYDEASISLDEHYAHAGGAKRKIVKGKAVVTGGKSKGKKSAKPKGQKGKTQKQRDKEFNQHWKKKTAGMPKSVPLPKSRTSAVSRAKNRADSAVIN